MNWSLQIVNIEFAAASTQKINFQSFYIDKNGKNTEQPVESLTFQALGSSKSKENKINDDV